MKRQNASKKRYVHFDKFIFRSPLYPVTKLFGLYDRRMDIKDILADEQFREAMFLASPDLLGELKYIDLATSDKEKALLSLLKYFIRSCTRCTPYGIFAGCGVGDICNTTDIKLDDVTPHKRSVRLDMGILYSIISKLASDETIKQQSFYTINNSILKSGNTIRYTKASILNDRYSHVLSDIENDKYLNLILDLCSKGAKYRDCVECLCNVGIEKNEATEYIDELIENQVLITELYPTVTGIDPLDSLRIKLKKYHGIEHVTNILDSINQHLTFIKSQPLGCSMKPYNHIKEQIQVLLDRPINEKNIFQADLFLSTNTAKLNSVVADTVSHGISILNKLTRRQYNSDLENFKTAFYRRYEDRKIPLLEALDIDIGIGFGKKKSTNKNSLLRGLNLDNTRSNRKGFPIITQIDEFLMGKYEQYLKNPCHYIEIFDEEIAHLEDNWDDTPETISALVETYTTSSSNGPTAYLKYLSGSTAAGLFSRFHHLSTDIETHVTKIVDLEDRFNENYLMAEICHLPEPRVGNILLRNSLRKFEIPYLCNSSKPMINQIALSDILISVPFGKSIRLTCRNTGKSIIPRLTSSHNYFNNPTPVYLFLCALQCQNKVNNLGFHWGSYLESKRFLPRVIYKNIVLCPARWKISIKEQRSIPKINDPDFTTKARDLLQKLSIPKLTMIKQGDNKLLINTEHDLSLKLLFLKEEQELVLEEFLFDTEEDSITKSGDNYTNEIIISYFRNDN